MKIIYIHQYFKTYKEGGSLRSFYLAKALAEQAFEVEIITSHNHKKYEKKEMDGFVVHYLPVYYDNQLGFVGRLYAFGKFMLKSFSLARSIRKVDLIYASSTPLTVGIIAYWLKKFYQIPYYFEVRDLWPQAPIELGYVPNSLLKKILFWLEKKIYQNAEKIIALSPGIADSIRLKIPEKQIFILPNMADCNFFRPEGKDRKTMNKFGLEDNFVIAYFGTIGFANHLEYLVDIACLFQEKANKKVYFLIIGKGAKFNHIQNLAESLALKNIRIIQHLNTVEMRGLLNSIDAVYISFLNKPVLETSSPNKFFDALAAGKLCLVNTQGWLRDLVEDNHCGFYANPEKPEEFYEKIQPFLNDKNLLNTYQRNARKLAEQQFSREIISKAFVQVFTTIE